MLTPEELSAIVFGQFRYELQEDGYLRFYRFTEMQAADLRREERGKEYHAMHSSGMRLEIEGTVEKISFDFRIWTKTESIGRNSIDVLENGAFKGGYKPESFGPQRGHFEYRPEESGRICLLFPTYGCLELKNVEITGGYKPARHTKKLLAFGDSITHGSSTPSVYGCYLHRLTTKYNLELLSQAVSGDTMTNFVPDRLDFKPDAITIAFGTNDFSCCHDVDRESKRFFRTIAEYFPGVPVAVITPIYRLSPCGKTGRVRNTLGFLIGDVRKQITENAKAEGFYVIDGLDMLPNDKRYLADGLHPNAAGHKAYGENLGKALARILPDIFSETV